MALDGRGPSMPIGLIIVLATGVLFLATVWPHFVGPFGNSHDGRNSGVWASGSREFREAGSLDSRLAGRSSDGSVYATHPPLILVTTALFETAFGERTWASRTGDLCPTLHGVFPADAVDSDGVEWGISTAQDLTRRLVKTPQ